MYLFGVQTDSAEREEEGRCAWDTNALPYNGNATSACGVAREAACKDVPLCYLSKELTLIQRLMDHARFPGKQQVHSF